MEGGGGTRHDRGWYESPVIYLLRTPSRNEVYSVTPALVLPLLRARSRGHSVPGVSRPQPVDPEEGGKGTVGPSGEEGYAGTPTLR